MYLNSLNEQKKTHDERDERNLGMSNAVVFKFLSNHELIAFSMTKSADALTVDSCMNLDCPA